MTSGLKIRIKYSHFLVAKAFERLLYLRLSKNLDFTTWRDGWVVESAPLLREYTSKGYRGFESLSLRTKCRLLLLKRDNRHFNSWLLIHILTKSLPINCPFTRKLAFKFFEYGEYFDNHFITNITFVINLIDPLV